MKIALIKPGDRLQFKHGNHHTRTVARVEERVARSIDWVDFSQRHLNKNRIKSKKAKFIVFADGSEAGMEFVLKHYLLVDE